MPDEQRDNINHTIDARRAARDHVETGSLMLLAMRPMAQLQSGLFYFWSEFYRTMAQQTEHNIEAILDLAQRQQRGAE